MARNPWNSFVATYRASHPSATMTQCSAAYQSNKKRAGSSSKTYHSRTYRSLALYEALALIKRVIMRRVTVNKQDLVIKISEQLVFPLKQKQDAIFNFFKRYFQDPNTIRTFYEEGKQGTIFQGIPGVGGFVLWQQYGKVQSA